MKFLVKHCFRCCPPPSRWCIATWRHGIIPPIFHTIVPAIPGACVNYTIFMHLYGYQKLMRSCTLHNYYAPCGYQKVMRLCTPAQLL